MHLNRGEEEIADRKPEKKKSLKIDWLLKPAVEHVVCVGLERL